MSTIIAGRFDEQAEVDQTVNDLHVPVLRPIKLTHFLSIHRGSTMSFRLEAIRTNPRGPPTPTRQRWAAPA